MPKPTNLTGAPDIGPLALAAAKEELLELAREKMQATGCNLMQGIGMVEAELRQRVANTDSIRRP